MKDGGKNLIYALLTLSVCAILYHSIFGAPTEDALVAGEIALQVDDTTVLSFGIKKSNLICKAFWHNRFKGDDGDHTQCIEEMRRDKERVASLPDIYEEQFRKKKGRGIVLSLGSTSDLRMALTTIVFVRDYFNLKDGDLGFELCSENARIVSLCRQQTHLVNGLNCVEIPKQVEVGGRFFMYKALSVLYSSFQHVLFIDSDSIPFKNPVDFFDSKEYAENGAIFWSDLWGHECSKLVWNKEQAPIGQLGWPNHIAWQYFDVQWKPTFKHAQELESGQFYIDTLRHRKPLVESFHCSSSPFLMKVLYGDKDCWRFSFLANKASFYYPEIPPGQIVSATGSLHRKYLIQYFHDSPAFLHQYKRYIGSGLNGLRLYRPPQIEPSQFSYCPSSYDGENIRQLKPGHFLDDVPVEYKDKLKAYNEKFASLNIV